MLTKETKSYNFILENIKKISKWKLNKKMNYIDQELMTQMWRILWEPSFLSLITTVFDYNLLVNLYSQI